jgi:hypothetical protein
MAGLIEMVSLRWCLRCRRRTLHVFRPSSSGGRWLCDRCPGLEFEVKPIAAVIEREGVAA